MSRCVGSGTCCVASSSGSSASTPDPSPKHRPELRSTVKRMLLAGLLALLYAAASVRVASGTSSPVFSISAPDGTVVVPADSIVLSVDEADSLAYLIDSLVVELRLADIEQWRLRQYKTTDSLLAEQRIRALQKQVPAWYERVLNHPTLWFVAGVVVGAWAVGAGGQ